MSDRLVIELANLPEEGKTYTGELDASVLKLNKTDLAKPISTLFYELEVQRFESELLLRGTLEATFELTCVRTNKPFEETIFIENCAIAVEITSGVVDVSEALREEVLIELPNDPINPNSDDKEAEDLYNSYLAVDKPIDDGVNEPPTAEGGSSDSTWDALDGLKDFKETTDE